MKSNSTQTKIYLRGNADLLLHNLAGMSHFNPITFHKRILPSKVMMLVLILIFLSSFVHAADRYSVASGNWNSTSIWSATDQGPAGASVPVAGDNVYIVRGWTVTVNITNAACTSLNLGKNGGTTSGTGTLTFASSGSPALTVSGAVILGGTNTSGGSTGTITFTSGSTLTAGSLQLGNSIGGDCAGVLVMTSGGTLNVGGSLSVVTVSGNTWTPGTGSVVMTANNTLPATIFTTFNNFTINGGTTTLGANTSITGNLSVSSGTLDLSTFTANRSSSGGTLSVAGSMLVGGSNNFPTNFTTFTATGGTVNYDNTGNQTIVAKTYNNLTLSGSGTKTVGSGTIISGNLTISGSAVTAFSGTSNTANALYFGTSLQIAGTWGATGSGATNINNTYFTGTAGNVNVATGSCSAPVITGQSTATQTRCIGGAFSAISVTATGDGLTYQWFSNTTASNSGGSTLGSANGGQTSSYTPQTTSAGTLYYYCVVTGTCGTATSVVSGAFIVNPNTAITSQSTGAQTQCIGGTFAPITVTVAGSGLSYQWYSNTIASTTGGSNLGSSNGAQTSSYTPQSASTGSLYYYCTVSGTCGAGVTSTISGEFLVNPATAISSQSTTGQTQCISGTFTPITVTATGTVPLTYQWYSNTTSSNSGGSTLGSANGAQTSSYTPQTNAAGTLYYYCTVSGTCGTPVTSSVSGAFVVDPATAISNQSTATQTQCIGGTFTPITVTATGGGLTYQWYSNISASTTGGTSLNAANGAQTNSFTPQATASGTLYYYCTVTGTCGPAVTSVISGAFIVNPATAISSQSTDAQTRCIGGAFTPITVTATGTGTLSYQWFSNTTASTSGGSNLGSANGAQTNSYTPQAGTAGTLYYYCVVTGTCATATSAISGAFVVNPASAITGQSTGTQTQCIGGAFTPITVTATGGGLTYQWYSNTSASTTGGSSLGSANGAQTSSYTPQASATGTLYYYCTVSGTCGAAVTSAASGAFLVTPASAINSQSTGAQTQCISGTFTPITVTATGTGTLTYQWYSNSTPSTTGGTSLAAANGAQTSSYTPQATTAGTVYYYCVVTSTCGSVTSAISGAFIVNPDLAITGQSTGTQTQCLGGAFTPITVTATGVGLTYQWYSNAIANNTSGTSLGTADGANTSSYTPQAGSAGILYYYCTVSGSCGAPATSSISGAFIVNPATAISSQSTGAQTRCLGGAFSPITVTATGQGTLTYQWFSNTTPTTTGGTSLGTTNGANTFSYTPQTTVPGTLYYYCVVNGTCGTATSAASGAFVVDPATAITGQATTAQTQCLGGTFTPISVTATGGGLTYQWYSNSTASTSGGTFLAAANGAQTSSYTPQATTVGTLYYYCVVTGTCGPAITSTVSGVFIVNPATAITGQSTGTQTQCIGGIFSSISVTASGIGLTYQWYSNPTPTTTGGTILGAVNGAQTSIFTPSATIAGTLYYYCVVSGSCGTTETSAASGAFIVNPATVINSQATTTQTRCLGGTFTPITVTATGFELTYQWYSNTVANNTGGTTLGTANGASTSSYTPLATTAGTLYYYCIVTGTCGSAVTSVVSEAFIVNPLTVGGSVTGGITPITLGSSTGTMTLGGHTGIVVNWQKMVGTDAWITIDHTLTTYSETPSTIGTWQYRATVKSGACSEVFSNALSIVVTTATDIKDLQESGGMMLRNHPNPFNSNTTLMYTLPSDGRVTLTIRNMAGQTVKTVVNEMETKGDYLLNIEVGDLQSGVYFGTLSLKSNGKEILKTIRLVKGN
jgi:large repetitive protein